MELLFALLAIQTAAILTAGVYVWRRFERQQAEIAELRQALAVGAGKRSKVANARGGALAQVIALSVNDVTHEAPPNERAQRAWNLPATPTLTLPTAGVSAETARGLTLGILAIGPALGFAFGASAATIIACGLAIGAAMMAIAHRPMWRAAAWAAVATSGAWALIGFAIGSAHADPASYSICAALAAATGLAHAHNHRVSTGITMALIMTIGALALSLQIGMVSPAGIAFGVIVAASAITGAMSLRLEGLHLGAFGTALLGLFVLSGQSSAAIWFTPVTAWAGAIFFAIAAIRVPQLGARGLAIAGTGALAPLMAITALYFSQHGLADHYAAAGGFAVLSALLVGVIAAATMRRDRGLDGLKATLWVLMAGAFAAFAGACAMALPAALAAPAFALAALGLSAIDLGLPSRAWRGFACVAGAFAVMFAFGAAHVLLREISAWPAFAIIGAGVAAPAAITGAAAWAAKRRNARASAGFLEGVVIILAVAAANLAVRLAYSGGATLLEPISFAELGAHVGIWLLASLIIRTRARHGVRRTRIIFSNVMLVTALGVLLTASALWMTPFWASRQAAVPFLSRESFGFLIPALVLAAHVRLWRMRGAGAQTRLTLAAGALLLAAFVTVEVTRGDGDADWLGAVVGALSFAAAIGVNFVPGVVRRSQVTSK
ncbi:hypothetical protein [Candidatus Viadribacter manganicus]|uniref:DUF2339 domain-containing protein n=1 Tax=Candidatus Viadribacter manganicus TaxID=1759059 RepID=A0A1B1ALS0_9PROT|nr:hypothetical protein [Candidatus Viadribacter manganicus]ANP47528.1 hypothetical protein ATE48_17270 [Candidatus Viadribacter manganicus]